MDGGRAPEAADGWQADTARLMDGEFETVCAAAAAYAAIFNVNPRLAAVRRANCIDVGKCRRTVDPNRGDRSADALAEVRRRNIDWEYEGMGKGSKWRARGAGSEKGRVRRKRGYGGS